MIFYVNAQSGSGEAAYYLTEYPPENSKLLFTKDKVISCIVNIFDITDSASREKAKELLE